MLFCPVSYISCGFFEQYRFYCEAGVTGQGPQMANAKQIEKNLHFEQVTHVFKI